MKDFDELKKWAWERSNMMIRNGKPEIDKTLSEIKELVQSNGESKLLHECLLQTINIYLRYKREDCSKAECEKLMISVKEKFDEYEQLKRAS